MSLYAILIGLVIAGATSVSLGSPATRVHAVSMADPCGVALPASRALPVASGIQTSTKLAVGGFIFYLNQFGARGLDAEVELLGSRPPAGDAVATWSLALPGDKSVYVGLTHVFTHGAQQHICVQGTAFLNLGNGSGAASAPSVPVSLDGTVSAARARIVARLGKVTYTLSGPPQVQAGFLGPPRVAVCQTFRLTITAAGSGVGLGHIGIQYRIHNASSHSCALSGYATVVLLDAARLPLPTTLTWGPAT